MMSSFNMYRETCEALQARTPGALYPPLTRLCPFSMNGVVAMREHEGFGSNSSRNRQTKLKKSGASEIVNQSVVDS
jgi:hypothetical protein